MVADIEDYRAQIEAALEYADGSHTFKDVVRMVDDGRAQFWPGPASVVVTEIIVYPQYSVLNFWLAGGKLTELQAMVPAIEEWGRSKGCTKAAFTGRKGWERTFLSREGWAQNKIVLEKAL